MEYTRQQLIESLPQGCEPLGLSDLPTALGNDVRVYAYATAPDFAGMQIVSLPTMEVYLRRLLAGWTFHLLYRGASRVFV